MEFDITVVDGKIVLGQEVLTMMSEARKIDLAQKQMKVYTDAFKEALRDAMEQNGIKKLENDILEATYKSATTRATVDTKKMKDEEIYDLYVKRVPVKSSVTVEFKEL